MASLIDALVRLELASESENRLLRSRFLVATRRVWRLLLPLLESRMGELALRPLCRLVLVLFGGSRARAPGLPGHWLVLLARLPARRRRELLERILCIRAVRLLRRCDRYLEAREKHQEFILPSHVSLAVGGACNLSCEGCFGAAHRSGAPAAIATVARILRAAERAGTSIVSILGPGEPFLDPAWAGDLLACIAASRRLDFLVFTNGCLIDQQLARRVAAIRNLFLLISIDGLESTHDRRRGAGNFSRATRAMALLRAAEAPFGFSSTVHQGNWREVTTAEFVEQMSALGCVIGIYNQFVPLHGRSGPTREMFPAEGEEYLHRLREIDTRRLLYVVETRTAEDRRYGCRAKKGTTCHIDAVSGQVVPCPLFPYSPPECNILLTGGTDPLTLTLRHPFFCDYRARGAVRRHCTHDLTRELRALAGSPGLRAEDRAQIAQTLAGLSPDGSLQREDAASCKFACT